MMELSERDEEALGLVLLLAKAAGAEAFTLEELRARGVVAVVRDRLGGTALITLEDAHRVARALLENRAEA
ncbi:MAG: hypothetical protein ACP5JV_09000 [Thermus sp.]|uniref:hypothetical protein n=1 Tax=Thermus sp. TaxID=275 RepID=UPI003D12903A